MLHAASKRRPALFHSMRLELRLDLLMLLEVSGSNYYSLSFASFVGYSLPYGDMENMLKFWSIEYIVYNAFSVCKRYEQGLSHHNEFLL